MDDTEDQLRQIHKQLDAIEECVYEIENTLSQLIDGYGRMRATQLAIKGMLTVALTTEEKAP